MRSTIYISDILWTDFKEICEREGEKMSKKIEAFIADYVMVHKKGNPQMMLASFTEEKKDGCQFAERKRSGQTFCGLNKYWMLESECTKCEKRVL